MSSVTNTFAPSQLVANAVKELLGPLNSQVLNCFGKNIEPISKFAEIEYTPGKSISYLIGGYPRITSGNIMKVKGFSERNLYITADVKRWYLSSTKSFNQTSYNFFTNPQKIKALVAGPRLQALKERVEEEAIQWLKENSPVIPTYGRAINQEITFPDKFDSRMTAYVKKLQVEMLHPGNYKLLINPKDDMAFSNNTSTVYNSNLVSQAITKGDSPMQMSGFNRLVSPYIRLHNTKLDSNQPRGPLRFTRLPESDENAIGTIKNMSGTQITLTAGDIIYHVANDTNIDSGLHWVQKTVKEPIPDSRYAFCVTSRKYFDGLSDQQVSVLTNKYSSVEYVIPANGEAEISLSHRPVFKEEEIEYVNCSREILTGDTGDQFYVMGPHYKNYLTNPSFAYNRPLELKPLPGAQCHQVEGSGFKILCTEDSLIQDGSPRGQILDVAMMMIFGGIPENLYTVPTGENSLWEEPLTQKGMNNVMISFAETMAKSNQQLIQTMTNVFKPKTSPWKTAVDKELTQESTKRGRPPKQDAN